MKKVKATRQRRQRQDLRRLESLMFECLEQRQMLAIDLDVSFGVGGITPRTHFAAPYGLTGSTSVVADGDKVVVAATSFSDNPTSYNDGAHLFLARYAANGTLDTSFGADHTGVVELDTVQLAPGSTDHPSLDAAAFAPTFVTTMTVNGEKKYVAVATKESTAFQFFGVYVKEAASIVVARFNSDGTPDTTFSPNGARQILTPPGSGYVSASGVTIDGQNIVIGGTCTFAFASATPGNHAVAIRLTANGNLDTTFDGDGYALAPLSQIVSFDGKISGVAVDGQHNVILAGSYLPSNSVTRPQVLRFTSAGALDATFGTGGRYLGNFGVNETATSPVADSSGRVTFGTLNNNGNNFNVNPGFHIVRLLGTGVPDPSFGTAAVDQANGAASDGYDGSTYYLGTDEHNAANVAAVSQALAIDPAGSVVVAGSAGDSLNRRFAMTRLTDSGAFDATFHNGRMVLTDVAPPTAGSPPYTNAAYSITFDSQNRIVLGGILFGVPVVANGVTNYTYEVALARYGEGGGQPNNFAPTATGDSYSVNKNEVLNVGARGVLSNDSDPESVTLTAVLDGDAGNGHVVLNADGSFTYTPDAGYFGPDSFTYHASDGVNTSNVVTVTIDVVNRAPVGVADSFSVNAGGALDDIVLGNDVDPDGDSPLSVVLDSGPANAASFFLASNGSFHYEPAAGYSGVDTFAYRPSDGDLLGDLVTVSITVNPPSRPPVATPGGPYKIAAGGSWYIPQFYALAYDPDADPIVELDWTLSIDGVVVSSFVTPTDGPSELYPSIPWTTLDLPTTGAPYTVDVSIVPVVFGSGRFEVGDPGTTTLTVSPPPEDVYVGQFYAYFSASVPNQPYDPDDQTATGGPNGPATLLGYDAFPNLQMAFDAVAPGGTVHVAPGFYNFGQDFGGPGGLLKKADNNGKELTLEVTFGIGGDAFFFGGQVVLDSAATLRVNIQTPADPALGPQPGTDYTVLTVASSLVLNGAHLELAGSYVPAAGDSIRPVRVNPFAFVPGVTPGLAGEFANLPEGGTIALNGVNFVAHYEKPAGPFNFSESYLELRYNAPPTAADDTYSIVHDRALHVDALAGILANDSGSQPLHAVYDNGPIHGVLDLHDDGSFDYTPDAGYVGSDKFTYYATDGFARSAIVMVNIAVINTAPVATDDFYTLPEDGLLWVNKDAPDGLVSNDADAELDPLTVVIQSGPSHGMLVLGADGITFTYTPDPNFAGADFFTYRAFDGANVSNGAEARVNLTVQNFNDAPTASADSALLSASEGDELTNTGHWGDADLAVDDLEYVELTADHGEVIKNDDGTWNWSGTALITLTSVTITATDAKGEMGSVTFDVNVANVPASVSIDGLPTGVVDEGMPIILTAVTTGVDPALATYQWYVNGAGILGAVQSTFVFAPPDGGSYVIEVDVTSPAPTPEDPDALEIRFAVSDPIQVRNVPPVVTINGPEVAAVGSIVHLTFTIGPRTSDTYLNFITSGSNFSSTPNFHFDATTGAGSVDVLVPDQYYGPYLSYYLQVRDSDDLWGSGGIVIQVTPRAGTLDPSFDGDGVATPGASIVAVQGDGKLLVSRGASLQRLNVDGSVDKSFKLKTQYGSSSFDVGGASSFGIQPDGRILVVGQGFDGFSRYEVMRLLANGSFDPSFGVGGIATLGPLGNFQTLVEVGADGKAIIATTSLVDTNLMRLNADGSIDTTFSSATIHQFTPTKIKQLSDGSIVVSGTTWTPISRDQYKTVAQAVGDYGAITLQLGEQFFVPDDAALLKINANGSLAPGFGAQGLQAYKRGYLEEFGNDLAVQPDGKLVLLANSPVGGFAVLRVDPTTGQLDPSFGSQGEATLTGALSLPKGYYKRQIAVQSDGDVLVAGTDPSANRVRLVRLTPLGQLDDTFGSGGIASALQLSSSIVLQPGGLALLRDGRIAVAAENVVARYFGDAVGSRTTVSVPAAVNKNDTVSVNLADDTYSYIDINGQSHTVALNGAKVIEFDGGGVTGEANVLQIVAGGHNVYNIPDPKVKGKGVIITSTGLRINYDHLTPIDVEGAGTLTLVLSGANDNLTLSEDYNTAATFADEAAGTVPALKIAGTSGGVGFEELHVFRTSHIVIDTTDVDGDDSITITGSNNAHGNGSLEIRTGLGNDLVTFAGAATFADGISVNSPAVALDADLTAARVTLGSDLISLGLTTADVAINGNLTAAGALSVDINGTTAGSSYDRLRVGGAANLTGLTVVPTVGGGYAPADGDVIEVVRAGGGVTPLASLAEGAAVGSFAAHYTTTQLALVALAANEPNVAAVRLASTAWSQDFKNYVDVSRGAQPGVGYVAAVGGAAQLAVPWTNLNQIAISFDRDIHKVGGGTFAPSDVAVNGVNGAYAVSSVAYNAATHTLLVTLADVLPADKVLVTIDAGLLADADGHSPAADFAVRFNVLPGDVDRDGVVLGSDVGLARLPQFAVTAAGGTDDNYSMYADLDGSGSILGNDVGLARLRQFSALPSGEPMTLVTSSVISLRAADNVTELTEKLDAWTAALVTFARPVRSTPRLLYRPPFATTPAFQVSKALAGLPSSASPALTISGRSDAASMEKPETSLEDAVDTALATLWSE